MDFIVQRALSFNRINTSANYSFLKAMRIVILLNCSGILLHADDLRSFQPVNHICSSNLKSNDSALCSGLFWNDIMSVYAAMLTLFLSGPDY
jgi:hypothetical protein